MKSIHCPACGDYIAQDVQITGEKVDLWEVTQIILEIKRGNAHE